ncbi:SIS domain-containing protein [Streptomyces sp. CB02923]|uniref:SIS domain-containing protein n=1 Tax=Streptomyces sp. CB02923 TaxID=1718985 RepID=UPI000940104C|nr:SIS domain-containing protein [Streptomyces sp. CB02923]
MSGPVIGESAVREVFARRVPAARELAGAAGKVAAACRDMARQFARGGKLIVFGNGGCGVDASHIAVEFMHPVVRGKRALPALALGNDSATLSGVGARQGFDEVFAHQLRAFAGAGDIALGVSPDGRCPNVRRALAQAREAGLLTLVLCGGERADAPPADHVLVLGGTEPLVAKEVHMTAYHLVWELTHVFLDELGPWRGGREADPAHDAACATCSDEARPMRVRRLLPGGLALAREETGGAGGRDVEISVALVEAAPGTTVLVHAGEAIALAQPPSRGDADD